MNYVFLFELTLQITNSFFKINLSYKRKKLKNTFEQLGIRRILPSVNLNSIHTLDRRGKIHEATSQIGGLVNWWLTSIRNAINCLSLNVNSILFPTADKEQRKMSLLISKRNICQFSDLFPSHVFALLATWSHISLLPFLWRGWTWKRKSRCRLIAQNQL